MSVLISKRFLAPILLLASSLFAEEGACCFTPPPPCELNLGFCEEIRWDVSFLYWSLAGDSLDYAFKKVTTPEGRSKEKVYSIDTDLTGGYRAGVLFKSPCLELDYGFSWTHFEMKKTDRHKIASVSGKVVSISLPNALGFTQEIAPGDLGFLKGGLEFCYNTYDFLVTKELGFESCPCFFRPTLGIRLANFFERLKSRGNFAETSPFVYVKSVAKSKFNGGGPLIGCQVEYQLFDQFSLLGSANGSFLYGTTTTRNDVLQEVFEVGVEKTHQKALRRDGLPMLDLDLGVKWEFACEECYKVSIFAAYESEFIFNGEKETLTLQGFTLTGALEF